MNRATDPTWHDEQAARRDSWRDHGSHTVADAEWQEHRRAMDEYDPQPIDPWEAS